MILKLESIKSSLKISRLCNVHSNSTDVSVQPRKLSLQLQLLSSILQKLECTTYKCLSRNSCILQYHSDLSGPQSGALERSWQSGLDAPHKDIPNHQISNRKALSRYAPTAVKSIYTKRLCIKNVIFNHYNALVFQSTFYSCNLMVDCIDIIKININENNIT